jgi:FtsZ-interacting cell division protein ZipA
MSSTMTIVIVIVVVLAVVALALLVMAGMRSRRSSQLRERFGPEYERAVEETGDQQQAERLLQDRMERRQELPIRDLEPAARERYAAEWHSVQSRFVDDPRGAVTAADNLVTSVMRDRGYPAESFEQQVADVSVDHAGTVDAYRRGRDVLANARGEVATDDLRQAMVHYRELFEELLGGQATEAGTRTWEARDDEPGAADVPGGRRDREVT